MIDAWDIYWVMQLDSINSAFFIISMMLAVIAIWALFNSWFNSDIPGIWESSKETYGKSEYAEAVANVECSKRAAKRAVLWAVPFMLVSAFLPSTKTAAAMVVVPAIANNENIQRESGELYELAKDALRQMAAPDKPKSDE